MDDVVTAVFWTVVTLVLAAGTTVLALRLLGVGRGWSKALAAGGVGWFAGGTLALGLADWDWGANGLLLHAPAIAVPTTMAAAGAGGLRAPPGSPPRRGAGRAPGGPRPPR